MKTGDKYKEKYAAISEVKQLITVEYTGGTGAHLRLFIKNGSGEWESVLEQNAFVGKAGVGRAAENDSKTPVGDFGMVCAFGIREDPGALLPYIRVDDNTWCCGDKEHYNRIIDIRQHPHNCKGEHMADYCPEYNYGLFFDYNIEGTAGLGFAIFLHCTGEKNYTGGCIAVDEDAMLTILQRVDEKARLVIYNQDA